MSKQVNKHRQITFGIKSNSPTVQTQKSQKIKEDPYQNLFSKEGINETTVDNILKVDNQKAKSFLKRKLLILQNRSQGIVQKAINGFIMGCMIGGSMGLLIGIPTAIKTRKFMIIPLSIIISGFSFGMFIGCGSIIRNQEYNQNVISIQRSISPILPYYMMEIKDKSEKDQNSLEQNQFTI